MSGLDIANHFAQTNVPLTQTKMLGILVAYLYPKNCSLKCTLDRESIASQYLDIPRNPSISEWISIKAWVIQGVPVLVCQTKLGDRDHRSKKILSKDPCPEMNRLASRRM